MENLQLVDRTVPGLLPREMIGAYPVPPAMVVQLVPVLSTHPDPLWTNRRRVRLYGRQTWSPIC